jgi:hypothetical protein
LLQKYAVARAGIFNDSHPQSLAFEKPVLYLLHRHIKVSRDEPDFLPAHPDIPPLRPGAATPALKALKMQTGSVPAIFIITTHNNHFTAEAAENAEEKTQIKITNTKSQISNKLQTLIFQCSKPRPTAI